MGIIASTSECNGQKTTFSIKVMTLDDHLLGTGGLAFTLMYRQGGGGGLGFGIGKICLKGKKE